MHGVVIGHAGDVIADRALDAAGIAAGLADELLRHLFRAGGVIIKQAFQQEGPAFCSSRCTSGRL